MPNKLTLSCLLFILLMPISSCNVMTEEANGVQAPAKQVHADKNPVNLPCFSCHSYDKFKDPENFPHSLHREMGLHCNQCHIIESHKSMSLNGGTCKNCHNLTIMKLSLTSMPVSFNHESHASMFGCSDCHKAEFKMKKNSVRMTMDKINKGRFCGKCHNGKMAFSASNCNSCHSTG